jgi:N-acetylmuramoyl-L-alanine amidase
MLKRFLTVCLFCLLPLAAFSQSATIQNIRVNYLTSKIQYVVDMSGMVPVTEYTYHHPYRKVFSFYHARVGRQLSTRHLSNIYIDAVKVQSGRDRVSLGLHMSRAYPVHASFWSANGAKGIRYVIDVQKHSTTSAKIQPVTFNRTKAIKQFNKEVAPSLDAFVAEHLGSAKPARKTYSKKTQRHYKIHKQKPKPVSSATEQKVFNQAMQQQAQQQAAEEVQLPVVTRQSFNEKSKRFSSKIIVVIDPGHGGKDPGATGPRGTHEKKVVLAIAKRLQTAINSNRGFKAVLTRGDDRYLTLRYRLALAREYHGDMFVAIHADAFINATAHGASVFALSPRGATSEAARWLAQRENQSELMGGVDLADKDRTLRSVLIDLSQTATISASLKMGSGIITRLRTVVPMHANHVEQAAFVVLKSPDIPSLLIETGFISNPTEEQQLVMRSHQKKLAQAITKGIVHYFKTHAPRGSWLATASKG